MKSIILSVGDELVLGQTVDTNSAWMSRQLAAAGLAPVRLNVVATNESALALYKGFGFRATDTVSIHAVATPS